MIVIVTGPRQNQIAQAMPKSTASCRDHSLLYCETRLSIPIVERVIKERVDRLATFE